MPYYDYKCDCGRCESKFNTVDDRRTQAPMCCGKPMDIKISAAMVNGSFLGSANNPGYWCPVSDQFVDSKRKRRDVMAEHNVIEKG